MSKETPVLNFATARISENDAKIAPPHHTPDFMIDDSQLFVGVKTFCQLVLDYPKILKN